MTSADQILRSVLAPLLLAQGLWVRRTAQQLPEPPGARSGGTGEGLRVLILGDSSAAGVGAETQSSGLSGQLSQALGAQGPVTWHLEAEIGATTKTSLAKLDALPNVPFDVALLVHGVNDTTRFTTKARFKARQQKLINQLRARPGLRHVILSGVPPMHHFPLLPQPLRWVLGCHAQRLDAVLAGMANTDRDITHLALDLPYMPEYVAIDGFHPSEKAYGVWAGMIADTIRDRITS